jgi:hypothetical protein
MHLGDVDIIRTDPRLRIRLVGRDATEMPGEIIATATRARDQRRRQNLDGAGAIKPLQCGLAADHKRRRAIADRRAHGARQRPSNQLVSEHVIDRHVDAVLRERIHSGVEMALGGSRRDLPLRRAIEAHVLAREGRVDIHEHAVLAGVGVRLRWQREALTEPQQRFLRGLHLVHIPAAEKRLEHQVFLVRIEHLLGADHEADLALPRLDRREGLVQPGRARAARILHVDDRDCLKAHRSQRALAADRVLVLHHALARVGEPRSVDIAKLGARVRQCERDRLARQILHGFLGKAAERRRADADDVDLLTHWRSPLRALAREHRHAGRPPACGPVHEYNRVACRPIVRKARQEPGDGDAQFEPGQCSAQTIMHAVTE